MTRAHVSMGFDHQPVRCYERNVDHAAHPKRMDIVAGAEQQHSVEFFHAEQATQATHRRTRKHNAHEITHLITTAVAESICVHAANAHLHAPLALT